MDANGRRKCCLNIQVRFANRHRINFRNISGEKSWRYHTRLEISRPINILSTSITPFVAEEIYYDFALEKLNQNRLDIGLSKELFEHLKPKIFYRLRSKYTESEWVNANIIGTALSISF